MIFVLNVFITFWVSQISKGAHFGGSVVGLLTAVPLDILRFGKGRQWWGALAALVLIPIVCIAGAVISLNRAGESIVEMQGELAEGEFISRYVVPVREIVTEVRATLQNEAEPLLSKEPADRSAEDVERVVGELARERGELTLLKKKLEDAVLPPNEKIIVRRKGLSKIVDEMIALLDLVQNRLRQGQKLTQSDRRSWQAFINLAEQVH
jgi:hypothetical protein